MFGLQESNEDALNSFREFKERVENLDFLINKIKSDYFKEYFDKTFLIRIHLKNRKDTKKVHEECNKIKNEIIELCKELNIYSLFFELEEDWDYTWYLPFRLMI